MTDRAPRWGRNRARNLRREDRDRAHRQAKHAESPDGPVCPDLRQVFVRALGRIHAHLMPGDEEEAVARLDALLGAWVCQRMCQHQGR